MRKNSKIRLTESQLQQVIKESIQSIIVQEGLMNTLKGAYNGAIMGNNDMQDTNSSLQTVSYGLSSACQYFGKIMKALSQQNIQSAQSLCKEAYADCKRLLNSTYNLGQTTTAQYGAQNRIG